MAKIWRFFQKKKIFWKNFLEKISRLVYKIPGLWSRIKNRKIFFFEKSQKSTEKVRNLQYIHPNSKYSRGFDLTELRNRLFGPWGTRRNKNWDLYIQIFENTGISIRDLSWLKKSRLILSMRWNGLIILSFWSWHSLIS